MSNEETALAVRQTAVIVPRTLAEVIDLAERLSKSTLLPDALKGKVPDVLMQIMAGQELGLYSMASLRSFNIISGKPVMTADAMVAVVLGSGKAEYFRRVEATDERVTYATKRRGEPEQRCTWTMQMVKDAALHQKDNWRLYKRQMLASRAKSELARDVYPDVLAGCFTVDEVSDREPSAPPPRDDVSDAEFTDAQPTPPPFNPADYPEIADLDAATTIERCREIAGVFAKRGLKPGHPAYEAINAKYKTQVAEIKKRGTAPALVKNEETGTLCSICNTPQVMSPAGITCKFGHGGAPSRPTSGGSSSAGATTPTSSGDSSDASTAGEATP